MMPHLLHADRTADLGRGLRDTDEDLVDDLELPILLGAMAGDELAAGICRVLMLTPLEDAAAIRYRQGVLRDCLSHPDVVEELDALAAGALAAERDVYPGFLTTAESRLTYAVRLLAEYLPALRRLRAIADRDGEHLASDGFRSFVATVRDELDDAFFVRAEEHLRRLAPGRGILLSARLGAGNRAVDHHLRVQDRVHGTVLARLGLVPRPGLVHTVPEHDEGGALALADLRNRGLELAADALTRTIEHVHGFFQLLRAELAFYRCWVRLHRRITDRGLPICWPEPADAEPELSARGLYDVCLALTTTDAVVGNDVDAGGRGLLVVTGANRGGKSTFLRSIGLAQLMMQCGMFVPAEAFRAGIRTGVFSHFRREEDAATDSGKLDQELRRMSAVVDLLQPRGLLLCNEPFASTNDREGSEIARQVFEPLVDAGVTVVVVTHLFDLAHTWAGADRADVLLLRAERGPDGTRTFHVVPGAPEATSYAEDLYRQVFYRVPRR